LHAANNNFPNAILFDYNRYICSNTLNPLAQRDLSITKQFALLPNLKLLSFILQYRSNFRSVLAKIWVKK